MTNGNDFSDMLMNVKGNCPNCGTTLTFMESAQLAKENNISEDAVMCHNCQKVYSINLTLHEMNFIKEITPINKEKIKEETKVEYSVIFKEAIEEENLEKAQNILKNWLTDYPDDANMFYATVIVRTLEGKSSTDSLNVIMNSASKVKAYDTSLENWYIEKANKSIEIQKELKDNKTNNNEVKKETNEYTAQNEIVRPKPQQSFEQNPVLETNTTQEIPKQPIVQSNIPEPNYQQQPMRNNINQPVKQERSMMEILFYKRDKRTQEFRISKTKTISILLFLFVFLFMLVSMIIFPGGNSGVEYIIGYIFVSLILAIMVAVPVFLVGYLISYLLERDSGNNYNQQYNQMNNQQYNQNQQNYQMQNQQYNQNINQQNYQNIPSQIDTRQQQQNIDYIQKQEDIQQESADVESIVNNEYYEKDNLGTRHDTVQKANAYWLGERFQMEEKYPFTLFTFNNATDAENALLELPYIHKASDTGNLICDDVYIFGYYKVNEDSYEAIICGKDLSYDEFKLAEDTFTKHGGIRKNSLEPEKNNVKAVNKTVNKKSSVKFREKFNKDQFTYECYDADTKADALEFLKKQEVTKGLYYICVYTPEGDFGRDIDGIYQM